MRIEEPPFHRPRSVPGRRRSFEGSREPDGRAEGVHRFDLDPAPVGSGIVETSTWVIELGVGLACLVVAGLALRNPRLHVVGILLLIAGIAAAGHAAIQLLRNSSVLE
jgi:hypothetical protein